MADYFGEPDIRKIASLPANIILHWQAWFLINGSSVGHLEQKDPPPTSENSLPTAEQQMADVMRILGS